MSIKLHETVETFEIFRSIVSIVSKVSCKFLHGDIGDDGDIANIATLASAFFPKRLDILLENVYTFLKKVDIVLNLLTSILILLTFKVPTVPFVPVHFFSNP